MTLCSNRDTGHGFLGNEPKLIRFILSVSLFFFSSSKKKRFYIVVSVSLRGKRFSEGFGALSGIALCGEGSSTALVDCCSCFQLQVFFAEFDFLDNVIM